VRKIERVPRNERERVIKEEQKRAENERKKAIKEERKRAENERKKAIKEERKRAIKEREREVTRFNFSCIALNLSSALHYVRRYLLCFQRM
jgi:type II secretory pathway component PulC